MCTGNKIQVANSPILCKINHNEIFESHNIEDCRKKSNYNSICPMKLSNYINIFCLYVNHIRSKLQTYKYISVLARSTQPAHFVTLISAILVAHVVLSNGSETIQPSFYLKLIYLGSFASHFGAQLWMTFVSGLSLYFALPRHTFSSVQKVLFPRYFLINSILSWITLFTFVKHQSNEWQEQVIIQVVILATCFCVELLIRLYMSPKLIKLITQKTVMEVQAGVGVEVGRQEFGCLSQCPHYLSVHSAFRKVHMTIAIGNMLTVACTALHLYYLSQKISF